jgi:transcriptional regulator with XRE-family HTH domain
MADDVAVGRMAQDVRRARGLSQVELAARAGVGRETVSRLERGLLEGMSVGALRAISRALAMPSIASIGWRGPELDRLRDGRHAAVVELVARMLTLSGWRLDTEYTFNHYGDRGSVDALAWNAERRALLIGEIKPRIWDLQDMLSALDRKWRVVPMLVARERGWNAASLGLVLFMPELSTHRHLIERHPATFLAKLPDRQVRVRQWIGSPDGELRGVYFLPNSHHIDRRRICPGR